MLPEARYATVSVFTPTLRSAQLRRNAPRYKRRCRHMMFTMDGAAQDADIREMRAPTPCSMAAREFASAMAQRL